MVLVQSLWLLKNQPKSGWFLANVNSRTHVHVRYMSSAVRLSVVCLSVTFVRPTQAIKTFGDVSTPFGTLAIC